MARLFLISTGGQLYLPDELRFGRSLSVLRAFEQEGTASAARQLLGYPDHALFPVVALVPAMLEYEIERLTNTDLGTSGLGHKVAAAGLSLASVGSIGLVYALARRSGMGEPAARCAAVLMALSTTMLYYARHLLGYDASLSLLLLGLVFAFQHPLRARGALTAGLCIAGGFLTYNGYFATALVAMLVCVWRSFRMESWRPLIVGASVCGFLLPILGVLALNVTLHGEPYLDDVWNFANSVTMGDLDEGWSLPWEYLWHTEHGLLLVWLGGTFVGIASAFGGPVRSREPVIIWVSSFLIIYALLALMSTGLGLFVVSARHARELVPFVCLAAASSLSRLHYTRVQSWVVAAIGAAALAQAVINAAPLFVMTFPTDFEAAAGHLEDVAKTWSVAGPGDDGDPVRAHRLFVNTGVIWPVLGVRPLPAGRTLAERPHPLEYLPYQYEGYRAQERVVLRSTDISMRLIQVTP
jgi:hypothetical protein